jgi:Uncharacterized conserved protein
MGKDYKTSEDTAGRDTNDLLEKGILIKQPGGGRSTACASCEIPSGATTVNSNL